MDFMKEYEKWVTSPALSEAERAELKAIQNDPKEIESRFYGPLEFGTAGLRGTMYTGLHNMNIHVIRWATQGFADHFEYFSHDFGQTVGIVPTTLLPRFGIDQRPDLRVFSLVDMDIASDFYALFNRSFIATENGRLLFEEMRRATEALAGM